MIVQAPPGRRRDRRRPEDHHPGVRVLQLHREPAVGHHPQSLESGTYSGRLVRAAPRWRCRRAASRSLKGTDMGGSVRIPAALCGVVGLKPSLGRIPMDILPTAFDSISHFGPLARTVEDAALFLSVQPRAHTTRTSDRLETSPEYGDLRPDSLVGTSASPCPTGSRLLRRGRGRGGEHPAPRPTCSSELGAQVEEDQPPLGAAGWWTRGSRTGACFCRPPSATCAKSTQSRMDPDVLRLMAEGDRMECGRRSRRLEFVFTEQWKRARRRLPRRFDALDLPHHGAARARSRAGRQRLRLGGRRPGATTGST